jgi:hypothetical protein
MGAITCILSPSFFDEEDGLFAVNLIHSDATRKSAIETLRAKNHKKKPVKAASGSQGKPSNA